MKIIHCVRDDDLMTIVIVTRTPFGDESTVEICDVKQVFVTDPYQNNIEVEKRNE